MKKLLTILLATSSVVAFADSFQDFNNNAYVQYGLVTHVDFTSNPNNIQYNAYGVGATYQNKTGIYLNADAGGSNNVNNPSAKANQAGDTVLDIKAGYAIDFAGDKSQGAQVVPYAHFGALDGTNYTWGAGALTQYRFANTWMAGVDLGINGNNGAGAEQNVTFLSYSVAPSIQYNIAKTMFVAAEYNYSSRFSSDSGAYTNALLAKFGVLF